MITLVPWTAHLLFFGRNLFDDNNNNNMIKSRPLSTDDDAYTHLWSFIIFFLWRRMAITTTAITKTSEGMVMATSLRSFDTEWMVGVAIAYLHFSGSWIITEAVEMYTRCLIHHCEYRLKLYGFAVEVFTDVVHVKIKSDIIALCRCRCRVNKSKGFWRVLKERHSFCSRHMWWWLAISYTPMRDVPKCRG